MPQQTSFIATNAAGSSCSDVFFFFVAAAVLVVLVVFDSPAVDYRFVAFGAVLPLVETLTGRSLILHTLSGSVLLLSLVMLATVGSRLRRRRWLGVPIATFIFLVVSGSWTRTELFWWPAAGLSGIGSAPLPEFDRPAVVLILSELVGIGALGWLAYRYELFRPENRRRLLSTGRLPRERPGLGL